MIRIWHYGWRAMSGNILIDDEVRSLETNTVLAERERDIRSLRQSERYLVDTNMLQSLPPRCAVNYGNGLARFVFTSPVPAARKLRKGMRGGKIASGPRHWKHALI